MMMLPLRGFDYMMVGLDCYILTMLPLKALWAGWRKIFLNKSMSTAQQGYSWFSELFFRTG